ncbi:MAG: hypothetical protein EHM20_07470 [Alphaproteobacteria bacterium]|nr:MAG: hypothetical protein EHM20_07470 [Alphaproteobacteria bacterium]
MKRTFVVTQGILKGKGISATKRVRLGRKAIYHSNTPLSAALKGFNNSCRKNKREADCKFVIAVREQTKDGLGKDYVYRVERIHDPRMVMIAGKLVEFKYRTKSMALNSANFTTSQLRGTSSR